MKALERRVVLMLLGSVCIMSRIPSILCSKSCSQAVNDLHQVESFTEAETSYFRGLSVAYKDSNDPHSFSIHSTTMNQAAYKEACANNDEAWCSSLTLEIQWNSNETSSEANKRHLYSPPFRHRDHYHHYHPRTDSAYSQIDRGTETAWTTNSKEPLVLWNRHPLWLHTLAEWLHSTTTITQGDVHGLNPTSEEDNPTIKHTGQRTKTAEDNGERRLKLEDAMSHLLVLMDLAFDPLQLVVHGFQTLFNGNMEKFKSFRGFLSSRHPESFDKQSNSYSAKGTIGICFPPECCEGACDLTSGMQTPIADGVKSTLEWECHSGNQQFCYQDGTVSIHASTTCGSYTLFEIIVMISVTAGSAVLGCACLIVLFRYVCLRLRSNNRFGQDASQPLLGANGYAAIEQRIASMNRSAFPYHDITDADKHHTSCMICLELFENDEEVCKFNGCLHLFHKSCLEEWLRRKDTCPVCRTPWSNSEQEAGVELNENNGENVQVSNENTTVLNSSDQTANTTTDTDQRSLIQEQSQTAL